VGLYAQQATDLTAEQVDNVAYKSLRQCYCYKLKCQTQAGLQQWFIRYR